MGSCIPPPVKMHCQRDPCRIVTTQVSDADCLAAQLMNMKNNGI